MLVACPLPHSSKRTRGHNGRGLGRVLGLALSVPNKAGPAKPPPQKKTCLVSCLSENRKEECLIFSFSKCFLFQKWPLNTLETTSWAIFQGFFLFRLRPIKCILLFYLKKEKRKKEKKEAASKKETGGVAKHVFIFIGPIKLKGA